MQYNLNSLWEMLESFNITSSEDEKTIFCITENQKNNLLKTLNDEQKRLFFSYEDYMSNLIETERKEAFIKGIKFATQFFLEATGK